MRKFREFYQQERERLFAYLIRCTGDYYLAGDILQEAFTRYLEKYGQRRPSPALLYTIARNALIDGHRKQGRDTPLFEEPAQPQHNPEAHLAVREEYRQVLAAMQKLAAEEREALSLAISSDLSYREIARITGTSEANVKVRVHRARVKLRKVLNTGEK